MASKEDIMEACIDTTVQTIADAMDQLNTDTERRTYLTAVLMDIQDIIMQKVDDATE